METPKQQPQPSEITQRQVARFRAFLAEYVVRYRDAQGHTEDVAC